MDCPAKKCYRGSDRMMKHLFLRFPQNTLPALVKIQGEELGKALLKNTPDHVSRCRACSGEDLTVTDCMYCAGLVRVPNDISFYCREYLLHALANGKKRMNDYRKQQKIAAEQKESLRKQEEEEIEAIRAKYKKRRVEAGASD